MVRMCVMPALLSLACVLMVTDFAHAQRRSTYGGGGYYDGRGGWGTPFGGVYFGAQPYPSGYLGSGFNGSSYYGPQYGSPSTGPYYGPRLASGYNPPASNDRGSTNPIQRTSSYYSPETEVQPSNGSATIRVIVPEPDARVYFDGTLTKQSGTDRVFHTPSLDSGLSNSYRIRAIWIRNGVNATQEYVVDVTPGATTVVEFR